MNTKNNIRENERRILAKKFVSMIRIRDNTLNKDIYGSAYYI